MEERRRISLEHDPDTGWTIREGDRYQDQLGRDEALWTIAVMLTNAEQKGYAVLSTAEEHAAREWRRTSEYDQTRRDQ